MERMKVTDEREALAELGESRTKPSWRQACHYLPFSDLSDNEFEVFCFLLLLKEYPGDRIYYYGKSAFLHSPPNACVQSPPNKRSLSCWNNWTH
jgi:hypothetical protein